MCVFLWINGRNIIKYFGLILFNNSNNFSVGMNKVLQMKRPYELKGNTKGWNHLCEMHYWIWTELNLIELKLWKITHSPKTWNQIQYYSALFVYQIIEEHQWKRKSIAMVLGHTHILYGQFTLRYSFKISFSVESKTSENMYKNMHEIWFNYAANGKKILSLSCKVSM